MNGKKAKQLRRMAKQMGDQMDLPYEDIKTTELPNKMVATPTGIVEIERTHRQHAFHSVRSWYKSLKKGYYLNV